MFKLTPYELRILREVATHGLTTTEIARKIGVSVYSVRNTTTIILFKTDSRRLAQAVYKLMKCGKLD